MAISMNWVKDYVDLDGIDLKNLANKITKAGVNVEAVIDKNIDNLVIGHVLETKRHPDSDHLNICKVDIGTEILQIVCGASNVRENLKVIVALPNAILPDNFVIKPCKIRGVESCGMICALYELGLEEKTEEAHSRGIHELDYDAPIGKNPIEYLGLNDVIYELDLNPNRNIDCTNHIGFAYEVAAVLGRKVKMPDVTTHPIDDSINNHFELSIVTDKCTLYNAKMVKDVVIGPTPTFIKNRLTAAGMRSINNVVDISNYIMLEYGQPLHFFDKDKLGNKIKVRMASEKEKIITLDNKERTLTTDDIVITDGEGIVCIAGVMGAENTEVDNETKNILIEGAIFNPLNVRYTSLNLGLRSEASLRYERGLNYEYTNLAIERACHLLEKYASGKVLKDTVTYDNVEKKEKVISVSRGEINKMLGMNLSEDDISKELNKLGFKHSKNNGVYIVNIPNRRLDIESNKADIIEEIGRLYGYDNIDAILPSVVTKEGCYVGNVSYRKLVSKRLRSLGLNEAKTYTLIGDEENNILKYNRKNDVMLLKPMSTDKKIVRQSIVPSLLKVINYNKSRNVKDALLYEIANTYYDIDKEDTKVAICMLGNYMLNEWNKTEIKVDFYLLKGIVEDVLDYLGLKNRYEFVAKEIDDLHPGISAAILVDKEEIGYLGRISPILKKDDIYVCEFSLNKLAEKKVKSIKYKEASKYPSIVKDMAFVFDKNIVSSDVINTIKRSCGKKLEDVTIFDYYIGDNIDDNKKSLAFKLTFTDYDKTLSDDEVMVLFNKAISDVEGKHDAKLRG